MGFCVYGTGVGGMVGKGMDVNSTKYSQPPNNW